MNNNNKFENLKSRISELESRTTKKYDTKPQNEKNILYELLINFFVTLGLGGVLGYSIDSWLNTKPIFFLICLLFGIISGLTKIYLSTK